MKRMFKCYAPLELLSTRYLDELEAIAEEKGGILPLLDAKWQKVYKTASPRGLFTRGEMRVA